MQSVSIVTQPVAVYPQYELHRHLMTELPGGAFVYGSEWDKLGSVQSGYPPVWKVLPQYLMGTTLVTEGRWRDKLERPGNKNAPEDHPVTRILNSEVTEFLAISNRDITDRLKRIRLLSEPEIENGYRGPALDVRDLAEANGIKSHDELVQYWMANGKYFENLVAGKASRLVASGRIYASPQSEGFKAVYEGTAPIAAWRTWATRSGKFDEPGHWHGQKTTTAVSTTERLNASGLSDTHGNARTYCEFREPSIPCGGLGHLSLVRLMRYTPGRYGDPYMTRGLGFKDGFPQFTRASGYFNFFVADRVKQDDLSIRVGANIEAIFD